MKSEKAPGNLFSGNENAQKSGNKSSAKPVIKLVNPLPLTIYAP